MHIPPRGRTFLGLGSLLLLILLAAPADAGRRFSHHRAEARVQPATHRGAQKGWQRHAHGWRRARGWRARAPVCRFLSGLEIHSERQRVVVRLLSFFFGCWVLDAKPVPEPEPEPEPTPAAPPDATILDAAGQPVADLGSLDVDHTVFRVPYATTFADPVVVLGPPTGREADPGVAQLQGVDGDGFRVRFAEWSYLDGDHGAEAVSYLVLAPGRHLLADGSEWEVGSLDLSDTGAWDSRTFSAPFAAPPALFLTVQTRNEDDPLVVRARDVTEDGFQAALFEEEGGDGVHGVERVGYLALASPEGSGRLAAAAGSLPYLVRRVLADDRRVPVLSASVRLEEEASADAELGHTEETLAFLAIGSKVFAQDLTSGDTDTAAVRRGAPEHSAILEWGTLPEVDDGWHTVPLARAYTDPVVVVGPMSSNGRDPGILRVRNVSPDAFEVRLQEWAYLNGIHRPERAFYLVADPGIQSLGGLLVEAGRLETSLVLSEGQEDVAFAAPFPSVPGVFAAVMTENGAQPVTVRVSDRTASGFRAAMQEEEASSGGHTDETLGWVAVQAGQGTTSDGRAVRVFDVGVGDTPVPVAFGETLAGRFPSVLARIVSVNGANPVEVRYLELTPDAVTLVIEEEQSADAETRHTVEDVSVFAAD